MGSSIQRDRRKLCTRGVLSKITLSGVRGFSTTKEISFREFSYREIPSGGGKTSLALLLDLLGRLLESGQKEIRMGSSIAYSDRSAGGDPWGSMEITLQRTPTDSPVSRKITLHSDDVDGGLVTKFSRFSENTIITQTKITVLSEGDSVNRPMTHFAGLSRWHDQLRGAKDRIFPLIGGAETFSKIFNAPWQVPGQAMTLARMGAAVLGAPPEGGILVFDAPALAPAGYAHFMNWVHEQASDRPLPQILLFAPGPMNISKPWRWSWGASW